MEQVAIYDSHQLIEFPSYLLDHDLKSPKVSIDVDIRSCQPESEKAWLSAIRQLLLR